LQQCIVIVKTSGIIGNDDLRSFNAESTIALKFD